MAVGGPDLQGTEWPPGLTHTRQLEDMVVCGHEISQTLFSLIAAFIQRREDTSRKDNRTINCKTGSYEISKLFI